MTTEQKHRHAANQKRLRLLNPESYRLARKRWREKNAARRKEYQDAWRATNDIHVKDYSTRYKKDNAAAIHESRKIRRERINETRRKRYNSDPARVRSGSYRWRAENRERVNAVARVRRQLNVQVERARHRAWYSANRETALASASKSRKKRYAKVLADNALRRARKRNAFIGDRRAYTSFIEAMRTAPRLRCYWCANVVPKKLRTIDHIVPLARGGADSTANLCMSCKRCNYSKGAKLPHEFAGQSEMELR